MQNRAIRWKIDQHGVELAAKPAQKTTYNREQPTIQAWTAPFFNKTA